MRARVSTGLAKEGRKAINPNSEIGEHTRPRVWLDEPRVQPLACDRFQKPGTFSCVRGFPRGRGKRHAGRVRSPIPLQMIQPGILFDRLRRFPENRAMTVSAPVLMVPFVLLLAAMALAPALAPGWWSRHYPKVALGLGAITAGVCLGLEHGPAKLGHAVHEYVSFIALIGSLYVVAGGIRIEVPSQATPLTNGLFLLAGSLVANVLGTTGAAMLLIRPWIHLNRNRLAVHQVVFFIFLVANVGGSLTPIGDPPLFIGFLQGVPFWWVAKQGWPVWMAGVGLLLAVFVVVDHFRSPKPQNPESGMATNPEASQWRFEGWPNLVFLAVILGAVFMEHPVFLREAILLAAAAGSYWTTAKRIHAANGFNFHPVTEVAVLFAGVFVTMIPALAWLKENAGTVLGSAPSPGVFSGAPGCCPRCWIMHPHILAFSARFLAWPGPKTSPLCWGRKRTRLLAISIGAVFLGRPRTSETARISW